MPTHTKTTRQRLLALAALVGIAIVLALYSHPGALPRRPHEVLLRFPLATISALSISSHTEARPPTVNKPFAWAQLAAAVSSAPSEDDIMRQLRGVVDVDPEFALDLVREGEQLYPDGRFADERSFLKMRALVHLGEIIAARDEAKAFHRRFPHSPFGADVFRLMGVRPVPRHGR